MSGPSFAFVGFGVLVAILLTLSSSMRWRQLVILAASVAFLASISLDPVAFLPLLGFLVAGYIGLRLVAMESKLTLPAAVVSILVLFAWIKKYVFVPSDIWLTYPYVTIGVSYILFRMLHLIIEARSDYALARISPAMYLEYLISFNTLVAGPIQDFDDFASQQSRASRSYLSWSIFGEALERIVVGLFKTNVLATVFSAWRLSSLATLHGSGGSHETWVAGAATFVLYPFFLYCNFAGYIDIVIGISLLMAWRLPENFDRPFSATSFIDFWNRWHITLSGWLKTYVYNPVLLSLLRRVETRRGESWSAVGAFFLTFFLVGVWHGQTAAFLFFGLLQGGGVSVNKLYQIEMTDILGRQRYRKVAAHPVYITLARGLTFTWFTFTLTWFWASWTESTAVWSSMSFGQWTLIWLAIFIVMSLALEAWEQLRRLALGIRWNGESVLKSRRLHSAWYTALLFVVVVVSVIARQAPPEIVYKQF